MKKQQIIRSWRDPEYRDSLTAAERALLPEHPAAAIDLAAGELALASGSAVLPTTNTRSTAVYSYGCSCICCV